MKDNCMISHHAEEPKEESTASLTKRFEQFGYQCFSENDGHFTLFRFIPTDDLKKDAEKLPQNSSAN